MSSRTRRDIPCVNYKTLHSVGRDTSSVVYSMSESGEDSSALGSEVLVVTGKVKDLEKKGRYFR